MVYELYRRLFAGELHHECGLHEEILARLPRHRGARMLDLGCGNNRELARYIHPCREVWGTDFQAHPDLFHPEGFRPLAADGTIPFPDAHFDLVMSVMVLEHIQHPRRFLREVARVLKPGASFVGHTINGDHYVTWIRRIFGILPHEATQTLVKRLYGREAIDTFPTWYRLNRRDQIRHACRGAALEITNVRRYATPCYFDFSQPLGRLAVRLDHALERMAPGLGRLYMTVTLRKKTETQTSVTVRAA